MLTIYLGEKPSNYVKANDGWFMQHLKDIDFTNKVISEILYTIDNAKYIGNYMIETRFKHNCATLVENLSTGCKTAINVYIFKNKVFESAECGKNALESIFNTGEGGIYIGYEIPKITLKQPVQLINNMQKKIIRDEDELITEIYQFFRKKRDESI